MSRRRFLTLWRSPSSSTARLQKTLSHAASQTAHLLFAAQSTEYALKGARAKAGNRLLQSVVIRLGFVQAFVEIRDLRLRFAQALTPFAGVGLSFAHTFVKLRHLRLGLAEAPVEIRNLRLG